jgi:hypothetical protein
MIQPGRTHNEPVWTAFMANEDLAGRVVTRIHVVRQRTLSRLTSGAGTPNVPFKAPVVPCKEFVSSGRGITLGVPNE